MKKEPKSTHPIMFVGAGPGDPELITVKGKIVMENADMVIYAGSLVPKALLNWTRDHIEQFNSASMNLNEIIELMTQGFEDGKRIVRLHTGDPSLYGAIYEQMYELQKRNIPYQIIPGVTAAFAAAASLQIEYTVPEVSQTLILTRMTGRTPVPEKENLLTLAAHKASMSIYLSMALIEEVESILAKAYGEQSICAIVYKASHPDEKTVWVKLAKLTQTVKELEINKHALIIVGDALCVQQEHRNLTSKLYDPNFSHEYRNKQPFVKNDEDKEMTA
jgi:precorrin-4/cobalt-precorrin-4 C11-methyltransferase